MDSNHRRQSQQIYSLPPLATWVTYQPSRTWGVQIKPKLPVSLKRKVRLKLRFLRRGDHPAKKKEAGYYSGLNEN
jgi:hypothetical protein